MSDENVVVTRVVAWGFQISLSVDMMDVLYHC